MRQNFLLDADDTLWENNIHFERVIEQFFDLFPNSGQPRREMRETLNGIERTNLKRHGYGVRSFGHSLVEASSRFSNGTPGEEVLRTVERLVELLANHDVELIEGVRETVEYLSSRHRLILLTKGDPREQSRKIDRSGLRGHFEAVEIVPEKDLATFRDVVRRHALDAPQTWMVGNSPRSDINPALGAGLNAVYIPHNHTWMLEHDELGGGSGRLLHLERFSLLREHF